MSFVINAGELDKRIHILVRSYIDVGGGYSEPWDEIALTCWAKFSRVSGTELIRANTDFAEIKVRFLLRTPSLELTRDMWVRYEGRDYDILYVNDYDDDRRYTELICTRKTQEGA